MTETEAQALVQELCEALDIECSESEWVPASDIIEAAKSAAWHSKILRSLVDEDDLQAIEAKIRDGVEAAVMEKTIERAAKTAIASEDIRFLGDLGDISARHQLATCQDALRKLIARVERVGGYATHDDQQALIAARASLGGATR